MFNILKTKKSPQRCEDAFWAYLGVHPTGVEPVTA